MHCYWVARGLAQKGHKVFVVTNANEVEENFRLHLTETDLSESGDYSKTYPEVSGSVKVYSTEPPDRSRLYYIPLNNPTVTRLAAIATDVIRNEKCEVIFTYYLEPYALAAHLASFWTGVPYIFKHAGSDLYRLFPIEDLQTAYCEVMYRANRIISSGGVSGEKLRSLGIPSERIISNVAFGLPEEYFNPHAQPFDINAMLSSARASMTGENRSPHFFSPLDDSLPILGIYGKVGEYKGSFDLLHAMSELIHKGFPFYLVAMSNGWRSRRFLQLVEDLGLAEYVRFIPFQPHWRVPSFIRSCTAITFLERDFPIAAHTPTIPTEVIACGKCLITSEEIARKQFYRTHIRNLKNLIVVPDPKEYKILSRGIRYALENPQRADAIGLRGFRDFADHNGFEEYVAGMEALLATVASERPVERTVVKAPADIDSTIDLMERVRRFFPYTSLLLSDEQTERVSDALAGVALEQVDASDASLPIVIGDNLLSLLDGDTESGRLAREVCLYEYKIHELRRRHSSPPEPQRSGLFISSQTMGPLLPVIRGEVEVVKFTCDIDAAINALNAGETPQSAQQPIRMLFHSGSAPHKINVHTERLLRLLADGTRTVNELLRVLGEHYRCPDESAFAQLKEECLSVLEGLHWAGIVEFQTPQPLALQHPAESEAVQGL